MDTWQKRRKYWILPQFQWRFLLMHLGLVGVSILLTGLVTLYFVYWQDVQFQGQIYMVSEAVGEDPVALSRWQIVLPAVSLSGTVMLLLTLILGVGYSHRLAGPIYRIQRTLDAMGRGEAVEPVCLREKDEFKGLADSVNLLIQERP